ncbi:hypothetical protein UlMin_045085 [Ulmus minor]
MFVHKQHNIFLSTYDLIVAAKSSRVSVFFIFNAIIITIFFGSFKKGDYRDHCYLYDQVEDHHAKDRESNDEDSYNNDYSDDDDDEEYDGRSDGYDEDVDDDGSSDDVSFDSEEDYEEEQEGGSDLEKRVEEFIAMVNKRWREEIMNDTDFFSLSNST